MWFLPACFVLMAAVTLSVPVGDEMNSVRSSGLSMRECHLSVPKVLSREFMLEPSHAQLNGFFSFFGGIAILGCELMILKATPTFTRPIVVPFSKVFSGTACSDGDDGYAVVDGSTGGSGLSKRKCLPLHPHSYHTLLFSALY